MQLTRHGHNDRCAAEQMTLTPRDILPYGDPLDFISSAQVNCACGHSPLRFGFTFRRARASGKGGAAL